MADHEFDPFKLSSGLPLVGATVTVESLTFGIDNEYDSEACVAIVTFQPDEGESQRQLYSVGKTFEAGGTGETLVHKTGKRVNLNDNSNYGRLVQSFTTMEGAAEAMAEVRSRGLDPFDGGWIEGMRFVLSEMKFKGYAGKGKDPSEAPDKTLIVFGEYLGTGDDEAPKKAAPKAASKLAPKGGTKAAPKEVASDDGDEDYGIDDDDVRKAVIKLATKHAGDFDAYSDKATDVDGVMENPAWRKAVMSTKPGSIWAAFGTE